MRLDPLASYVVVRPLPPPEATGAIHIVRAERQPVERAEVEAVGPDVRDARVGQRVLISRLQGVTFGEVIVLPETAILATLGDDA